MMNKWLLAAVGALLACGSVEALPLCADTTWRQVTPENCKVTDVLRRCSFKCTGDLRPVLDPNTRLIVRDAAGKVVKTPDLCVHELEFYIQQCEVDPSTGKMPGYCPKVLTNGMATIFATDLSNCQPKWNPDRPDPE